MKAQLDSFFHFWQNHPMLFAKSRLWYEKYWVMEKLCFQPLIQKNYWPLLYQRWKTHFWYSDYFRVTMMLWMITDVSEWMSIREITESWRLDIVRNIKNQCIAWPVKSVQRCFVTNNCLEQNETCSEGKSSFSKLFCFSYLAKLCFVNRITFPWHCFFDWTKFMKLLIIQCINNMWMYVSGILH